MRGATVRLHVVLWHVTGWVTVWHRISLIDLFTDYGCHDRATKMKKKKKTMKKEKKRMKKKKRQWKRKNVKIRIKNWNVYWCMQILWVSELLITVHYIKGSSRQEVEWLECLCSHNETQFWISLWSICQRVKFLIISAWNCWEVPVNHARASPMTCK